MDTNGKRIEQLTSTIEHLTSTLAVNERRYQAIQRKLRIVSVIIMAVVMIAIFSINQTTMAQQATMAPSMSQQQYNNMLARSQRLNVIAERVLQQIEQQQEQVGIQMKRATAEGSEESKEDMPAPGMGMDMGAMIMLMLHDMKVALELVPQMATDMRAMSMVAQDMNHKMTVITSNMDSTMGRMGRNMPWLGW